MLIVLIPFTRHKFPSPYTPPLTKYICDPLLFPLIVTSTSPIVVGTEAFVVALFPLSPPPNTLPFITTFLSCSSINTFVAYRLLLSSLLLKYTLLCVPPPYTFPFTYPPFTTVFVDP